MAGGDAETQNVRRLVEALQALRGAQAIEVRGEWALQDEARAVVADFVQVFGLDAEVSQLADGFRIVARGRSERTIRLDF